jgi:hypothetical protein
MRAKFMAFFCIIFFLSSFTAVAGQGQKPFNASELDKFINDYPKIVDYLEEHGEDMDYADDPDSWQAVRMNEKFVDYVRDLGWSPERLGYVGSHVARGVAALEMKGHGPEMRAQLEEARKAIMSNPSMSEQMKRQMLAQMEQSMAMTDDVEESGKDLPPSEMALIQANRERILKAFEAE